MFAFVYLSPGVTELEAYATIPKKQGLIRF